MNNPRDTLAHSYSLHKKDTQHFPSVVILFLINNDFFSYDAITVNGHNVKVSTQKYITSILVLFNQSTMLHQGVTNILDPQMKVFCN